MEWLECCSCIEKKNVLYHIKGKSYYIQLLYVPSHDVFSFLLALLTVSSSGDSCKSWQMLTPPRGPPHPISSHHNHGTMSTISTLPLPQYLYNVDTLHITQYVWWEHNITELTTPCIPDKLAPLLNNKTYLSVCGKIVTSHNILKALIFVNFRDIKIRFWQLLMVMFYATKKCRCRMMFSTLTNFQDWELVRNIIVD